MAMGVREDEEEVGGLTLRLARQGDMIQWTASQLHSGPSRARERERGREGERESQEASETGGPVASRSAYGGAVQLTN